MRKISQILDYGLIGVMIILSFLVLGAIFLGVEYVEKAHVAIMFVVLLCVYNTGIKTFVAESHLRTIEPGEKNLLDGGAVGSHGVLIVLLLLQGVEELFLQATIGPILLGFVWHWYRFSQTVYALFPEEELVQSE